MNNIFNSSLLLSLAATGAFLLPACSSDSPEIPENPEAPKATIYTTDRIIYEANARMYASQDGLKVLKGKLQEIRDYGTDILWLMPINTPGEDRSIGSPYCVKDYDGVDPRLGSMQDVKDIVAKSHELGMTVILDWVANHTAWDHTWTSTHPDWYVRDAQGNILPPQSWTDVAELNYDNTEMRAAMIASMTRWITNAGIDGFRFDNVDGVPDDFWKEAADAIRAVKSDAFLLGETARTSLYDCGFDMIYGWSFGPELSAAFTGNANASSLIAKVNDEIAGAPDLDGTRVMRYAVNHDTAAEKSIPSLFGSDEAQEAAYALALFMGGTPMFYTSQLCNYSGTASFFTYGAADFDPSKTAIVKHLNSIFKATADVRRGAARSYEAGKAIMMERRSADSRLLIIVNPTSKAINVKTPIEIAGLQLKDLTDGSEAPLPVMVNIPAYGYKLYLK